MLNYSGSYKNAGVDVTAGYKAVELIKKHIVRTNIPGVIGSIGGFGGLFEPDIASYKNPVLVSGTDGVGTKLKIAFLMDKHDTVGIDCVAMSVNDIVCSGAKPLFFLDYIALGHNEPEKVASIVSGVAEGCVMAGCALIGGETAEMPGFYKIDEYDIAGFGVGIVDKDKILDQDSVKEGDVLVALMSSGMHSNGFSLVRKVFDLESNKNLGLYIAELGRTLGEELITPTNIYVKPILKNLTEGIHSVANITGGGFYENIPRALPKGLTASVERASLKILPIFNLIKEVGKIPENDMFGTFNMGVGMCVVCDKLKAQNIADSFNTMGYSAYIMGEVTKGDEGVKIW